MPKAGIAAGLFALLSSPAQAGKEPVELSFTYLDVSATAFRISPVHPKVLGKPLDLNGGGVAVVGSVEVHRYFHLWANYEHMNTYSDETFDLLGGSVRGSMDLSEHVVSFGAGWHHAFGLRSAVYFELGGLWRQANVDVRFDSAPVLVEPLPSEWGFQFLSGVRTRPWNRLEFELGARVQNLALVNNMIYFSGSAQYLATDYLAAGVFVEAGTDSFLPVGLRLRLYPTKLYGRLKGD